MTPHPYLLLVVIICVCTQTNAGTDFDIRLSGGPSARPNIGRVELYYNGSWRAVPGDCHWDYSDTDVACRMLGYSTGQKIYLTNRYGNITEPIWKYDISCTGTEDSLAECLFDVCDLEPSYPACVFCYNITDGADIGIRLSGGSDPNIGCVEVYYSGYWGSVCGDSDWDGNDADVTCRMLGYSTGYSLNQTTRYGSLTDPIWMTGVDCNGTEDSLADCSFDGWGQVSYCKSYPASVACSNITEQNNPIITQMFINSKFGSRSRTTSTSWDLETYHWYGQVFYCNILSFIMFV